MKLVSIEAKKLFGNFDHEIPLNFIDRVTIVHGPNGYGKTMMLKMIASLIDGRTAIFEKVPFEEFNAKLDDGSKISVRHIDNMISDRGDIKSRTKIEIVIFDKYGKQLPIVEKPTLDDVPRSILDMIDQHIPSPFSRSANGWLNRSSGKRFSLNDILDLFPEARDHLPEKYRYSKISFFDDLEVFFVETTRLDAENVVRRQNSRILSFTDPFETDDFETQTPQLRVNQYSKDVVQRIKSALGDYARHSQESDRTFPERLVRFDRENESALSEKEILNKMSELETKRKRLISIGFLDSETGLQGLVEEDIKRAAEALTIYVKDVQLKLAVFDDLADRVGRLMDIVNARFKNKTITLNRETGFKLNSKSGEAINLEDLSSGEQHELVVLYELLFRAPKNGLILVDEPEISLHVAWQSHFLSDLMGILKLTNSYGIVATHSPVIIGSRWDITKELKAPKEEEEEEEKDNHA